jgi:hypothetical protein
MNVFVEKLRLLIRAEITLRNSTHSYLDESKQRADDAAVALDDALVDLFAERLTSDNYVD